MLVIRPLGPIIRAFEAEDCRSTSRPQQHTMGKQVRPTSVSNTSSLRFVATRNNVNNNVPRPLTIGAATQQPNRVHDVNVLNIKAKIKIKPKLVRKEEGGAYCLPLPTIQVTEPHVAPDVAVYRGTKLPAQVTRTHSQLSIIPGGSSPSPHQGPTTSTPTPSPRVVSSQLSGPLRHLRENYYRNASCRTPKDNLNNHNQKIPTGGARPKTLTVLLKVKGQPSSRVSHRPGGSSSSCSSYSTTEYRRVLMGSPLWPRDNAPIDRNYLKTVISIKDAYAKETSRQKVPPLNSTPTTFARIKIKKTKPLARFRQAVRTVQFLLKATLSSRQEGQRSEARLLSFAQYQDELEATHSAIYGTGLTFNPSEYKAIREIQLSQETKAALRMDPEERTEEHLRLALVNLQQAVSAFSEYPTNIKQSLVRVGWYERYETKRVIIRQGHRAENFYFIISGTAVVTLLVVDPSSGESYVRTAAFLGKGNSFGEIGLMHGSQRSATVTCKEDVELLAVRREDFVDIFMHIESDQEPDHIRFLRCLDILDGWPVNKIPWDDPKICLFTYFRRGTVMCKDSSQAEWIYFFKTGTCRVLMALHSTKPQPLMGSQPPSRRESKLNTPRQSYEGSKLTRLTQALHAPPPPPKAQGGKAAGLPPLHRRKKYEEYEDTETDLDEGDEHKKMILKLYKEKHPHTKVAGDDPLVPVVERILQPVVEDTPPSKPEMVFVELQKLGPKDTFGVAEAAFCGVMSSMAMSLVSDGAEAVLISRKFFMQHLSDEKRRQLRETVQPYPTEDSLQQKLQDKTNWEAYKNSTIRQHVAYKQFVNDSLNW